MTKQVNVKTTNQELCDWNSKLLECLYSPDSENICGRVHQIRISYEGSQQQHAPVQLQGVQIRGVVNSRADITTVGGEIFRRFAAASRLRKSQLK